jgi:hypothetical protein
MYINWPGCASIICVGGYCTHPAIYHPITSKPSHILHTIDFNSFHTKLGHLYGHANYKGYQTSARSPNLRKEYMIRETSFLNWFNGSDSVPTFGLVDLDTMDPPTIIHEFQNNSVQVLCIFTTSSPLSP